MTTKNVLLELREKALEMLKEKLPANLSYHNYEHTLDVLQATERIAISENASSEEVEILKTAAVFHDTGYIYSRENHEERSCAIAKELLSSHGIENDVIEKVCDLILATKVPQQPKDKLSEIICDADLDYLGRDDYFPIARHVFDEFKTFGIVKDEADWKKMQVKFFESHHYFTKTAIDTRNRKKKEHLDEIRKSIE